MVDEMIYSEDRKSDFFGFLEDFLHDLFKKSDNETRANLTTTEWLVYLSTLIFVLVMPFLYSRLTTENFLTPKEFFSRGFIGLIGGVFCAWLFCHKKVAFAKTTLDLPIVAFFGFCALSVIWNFNGISAIRDLRGVFVIMLLFPIIVNVFRSRWQVELLLWIIVFTAVATATIGFMETYNFYFMFDSKGIHYVKDQVLATPTKIIYPDAFYLPLFPQLADPNYAMGSVVSTFGNRNYLGTYVMFVAFIPLAFFFYYRNIGMKCVSIALFGWLAYGLYMTRCRAALIGLAVGIVFMLICILINDKGFKLIKKNRGFFGIVAILILLGLVVSAMTIQSESMWDKIKLTFTLDRLVSNTYERMWVWYGNNQAFTENIGTVLFGKGFGSFKHFFPLKEGAVFSEDNRESFTAVTFRQAHNDWIQIFSELGIIGMILFLFLLKRLYGSIQTSLRKDVYFTEESELNGDHVLIIALGAAIVSQLFASLPDFPFHRIETADLALVFLALIPVLTGTNFFKSPINRVPIDLKDGARYFLVIIAIVGAVSNLYHEHRCWQADTKVREAEMLMQLTNHKDYQKFVTIAKKLLDEAIELDPLPGDPYCKLSAWYELIARDADSALKYADMAWKNINFNARSTYHSVIFRKLHIYYHLMNNMQLAYNEALKGLKLTAGDARSMYYLYAGKIGADMLRYGMVQKEDIEGVKATAEKYLLKCFKYPSYELQAKAALAIMYTQFHQWAEGYQYSKVVSEASQHRDPTLLNTWAICASNLGRDEEAITYMQAALRFVPNHPVYNRDLALIYRKIGRIDEAKHYLEKCVASSDCPENLRKVALEELDALK